MSLIRRIFGLGGGERVVDTAEENGDMISVVETPEGRSLKLNNVVYSRLRNGSVYTGAYWDYFTPLPLLYRKCKILMIGLGGGTIPLLMERLFGKRVSIDAVEISETMVKMSKSFARKALSNTRIIIGDGADYLRDKKEEYDVLILDAYEGDHIPDVFFGDKFVDDASGALNPDGILAINYALNLSAVVHLEGYKKNLRRRFKVYTINNPLTAGNMIILGSKKLDKEQISKKLNARPKAFPENKEVFLGYKDMS